ncbi:helix-turn-helix domain-containing protein [Brevundimonas sp.]|uniref:helix-turn-helix domain-containing protein n=1 Tax=Brevundimonas sp. TaxID=1871086 RepID=UPI002FC776B2
MSEHEAAIRIGEALGRLRRERGLSQAEAGARIGMTSQGWSLYEAGRRAGLFRPDMQKRLTAALDATPEDLMLLAEAAPSPTPPPATDGSGVRSYGRDFEPAPSRTIRRERYRLDTDDMGPWADLGTIIEYERGRQPKRGGGAVVQMQDGRLHLGLWQGSDDRGAVLANAAGAETQFPWRDISEVSAVTARLEPD